jgi:hypothetical protein
VDPGKPPVVVDHADGADLDRHATAVGALEVQVGDLLAGRIDGQGDPAGARLVDARALDHLAEVLADELVRTPAGHPLHGVRHEREPTLGVGREDDVGRVLDEEAVAALRVAQLLLEPLLLAHVADRAVGRPRTGRSRRAWPQR